MMNALAYVSRFHMSISQIHFDRRMYVYSVVSIPNRINKQAILFRGR